MKLYQITAEMAQIQNLLTLPDSDYSEEDLKARLAGLQMALADKLENTVTVIKSLEAESKAVEAEMYNLRSRASSLQNRADWLKNYIGENLPEGEVFKTNRHLVKWNFSTKSDPYNEAELPPEYIKTKTETSVDKKKLLEDLRNGIEIPGARLLKTKSLAVK